MKVISDKPVKTEQVVCENCAYLLEYTGEDVCSSGPDSDGDSIYWVVCPRESCRHKTHVRPWSGGRP